MAKQTINIGASPNDGTGTPLRTSFDYCNQNFTELYTATGPSGNNIVVPGSATITGDLAVRTTGLTVNSSGVGIGLTAALGAGNIQIGAGKYLGYSASAYITPEDNVQGARFKADNILIDGNTSTKWNIGGTSAMTLNSTGLGVGMTPASSQSRVQIYQALGTTVNGALHLTDNATTSFLFNNTSSGVSSIWTSGILTFSTGSNAYSTNGARMTLNASGNLLVGTTTANFTNTNGFVVAQTADATYASVGHITGTATGAYYCSFGYNGTQIGSITQNGTTGVLYNINSDYRLKESVAPLSGGLARVNALKPSIYKWKSDGSAGEGFLAHELAEVVPFAVTGEKDAVNEDGTIKTQGIDMSRIVPILVAAIKELTARVEALEA